MHKSIFYFLLLNGGIAFAVDPSPAPAPSGAAQDDVAASKTPDALWAHISDQTKALSDGMRQQDRSVVALIPKILTDAKGFAAQYPTDPHVWEAKMLVGQIGGLALRLHLDNAPTPEQLTQEFTDIANAKDAPKILRAEATAFLVSEALQLAHAGTGDAGANWDAADAKIAAFEKEFGPDFTFGGAHPAIVVLRAQQLSALKDSPDTARYQATLQKLSGDTQLEVAAMASQQLAAQKKMAELKTKPLDLKFTAVDGTMVDLAKLRGKVVLIDFWATWCGPCVGEVPNVVAAYKKYHDQGFEIVGISLDQDKDKLLAFTKNNGMVWPQYFDGQGWENAISKSFGIRSIPAMWLVGKNGFLITTDAREDLTGEIEKALKAP